MYNNFYSKGKEYIASYVNNLKAQLENTYIQDENGNKTKLKKKGVNSGVVLFIEHLKLIHSSRLLYY